MLFVQACCRYLIAVYACLWKFFAPTAATLAWNKFWLQNCSRTRWFGHHIFSISRVMTGKEIFCMVDQQYHSSGFRQLLHHRKTATSWVSTVQRREAHSFTLWMWPPSVCYFGSCFVEMLVTWNLVSNVALLSGSWHAWLYHISIVEQRTIFAKNGICTHKSYAL